MNEQPEQMQAWVIAFGHRREMRFVVIGTKRDAEWKQEALAQATRADKYPNLLGPFDFSIAVKP